MEKRGQVTLFVVLGIVIVVLLVLLLYARQTFLFPATPENLNEILDAIEENIIECITDVGDEPIRRVGLQGGYLEPSTDTFRLFNDTQISYLCYDIPRKAECRNRLLLISDMESQLNNALKARVLSCMVDVKSLAKRKPITIETPKELELLTKINIRDIDVTVDYPVIIISKKDETTVKRDKFTKTFNYPLGDLYNVMHDIIDSETEQGEFDQLLYMIAKKAEYKIYKNRPYPDKLYALQRSDNSYQFQFFVQGEPS